MNIHVPAFTRRRFLRTLGQGTLLAALPTSLLAESADLVTISILHTTDLHGHILPTTDYNGHADLGGLARCATQIRQWQTANPNNLLLEIGDIYEGTELGLHTRGATMINCLNALKYDAWVVGNHEFDWGIDTLTQCIGHSQMPVLCANSTFASKAPAAVKNLNPSIIKTIAGIRIAIIGLTTPGLTSWLPPENLRGFEILDPIDTLRSQLKKISALKPDAIILAGHMGLKRRDDFANRVTALTAEFPQIAVFLGAHTHQNHPGEIVNNVLYTQADHFGIYAGKVDLTFDRNSRKLLHREAITVSMDHQVALDPLVLSIAQPELDNSAQVLAQKIGDLTENFSVTSSFGAPSDVERLIASSMIAALRKKNVQVDAVVHGLFDPKVPLLAGPKTIADAWTILPYENEIVTVDLTPAELLTLATDLCSGPDFRNIMGLQVTAANVAGRLQLTGLRANDGNPLTKPTYKVAVNSYDSQSAGQRFTTTAKLVAQKSNHRTLHQIQVRDALIDFFTTRQKVGRNSLLV